LGGQGIVYIIGFSSHLLFSAPRPHYLHNVSQVATQPTHEFSKGRRLERFWQGPCLMSLIDWQPEPERFRGFSSRARTLGSEWCILVPSTSDTCTTLRTTSKGGDSAEGSGSRAHTSRSLRLSLSFPPSDHQMHCAPHGSCWEARSGVEPCIQLGPERANLAVQTTIGKGNKMALKPRTTHLHCILHSRHHNADKGLGKYYGRRESLGGIVQSSTGCNLEP